ncbi:hypothetical protein PR048_012618 [Dryococelus australis]|uniref:Uncharacterized protein n=1 Tax=Dryococelus australis TaxID=614101 RepID=A0ABQ9HPY9_9NEOP|nr:hypothetical protein PR048_012618 [Dryococelus australis]
MKKWFMLCDRTTNEWRGLTRHRSQSEDGARNTFQHFRSRSDFGGKPTNSHQSHGMWSYHSADEGKPNFQKQPQSKTTFRREYHYTPKEGMSNQPCYRIPFSLHDKLKDELDRMLTLKVIDTVTEPIEWLNPIVIVSKLNGEIRMSLDPQPLNATILREHYRLPTL